MFPVLTEPVNNIHGMYIVLVYDIPKAVRVERYARKAADARKAASVSGRQDRQQTLWA